MSKSNIQNLIKIIPSIFIVAGLGWGLAIYFKDQPKTARIIAEVPAGIGANQVITVPIFMDTQDYTINAAEVYLRYDPSKLQIDSVAKEDSIFQIWITDQPKYSNESGELSFAGGLPNPGFKGRGQIGTVTLRKLSPGATNIMFEDKTRILLNDGKGTAIPLFLSPITIP